MTTQRLVLTFALVLAPAATLVAGPPLICQPVDIGSAKSLPWTAVRGWNGADPKYDLARLIPDTLALLHASAPVPVRMETMRRAAVYAARNQAQAAELTARLTARALDAEAAGRQDPSAWFDAGYWVETLRQVSFIYRYDMLSPAERTEWRIRKSPHGVDGYPWVRRAVALGGQGMQLALDRIAEYRDADLRQAAASSPSAAQTR